MQIARKAVREVDARRHLIDLREVAAEADLRLGIDMPADRAHRELALRVRHVGAAVNAPAVLQQPQPRGGAADRAAEVDAVAGAGAAPQQRAMLDVADRGDRDRQLLRSREVPADEVDVVLPRRARERLEKLVDLLVDPRRQSERDERVRRQRAHRREVREIHSEALPRHEAQRDGAREVDVLDEHVGRDHVLADDRGVVADADLGAALREELAHARDDVRFLHRRSTGTIGSSGRSNVSPR